MTRDQNDQTLFRGQKAPSPNGGDGETQAHLGSSKLWKAALEGAVEAFSPLDRQHLAQCPTCQKKYEQVIAAVQTAAAGVGSAEPEPADIEEPIVPQGICRLTESESSGPPLFFDNGLVALVARMGDGRHWLVIEHPEKLPLLTLRVHIKVPSWASEWQRITLLSPQTEKSEARLGIEDVLPAFGLEAQLLVEPVEDELPTIEELPLWRASLARAIRDQAESVSAWKSWVDSLAVDSAEPEVMRFLKQARAGEVDLLETVVCEQGLGQFISLVEAVRHSEPCTVIRIRPGLYREHLVLDRPLTIIGNPQRRELAVVEGVSGPAFQIEAKHAHVSGMTFRGHHNAAVVITHGEPLFEDCDISGGRLASVWARGEKSAPVLSRCRIHDSLSSGALFHDQAGGQLRDCELFANGYAGVEITLGANVAFATCAIRDNLRFGILVSDGGRGTIENGVFAGHQVADACANFEASMSLKNCSFQGGQGVGALLHDSAEATLQGCKFQHYDESVVDVGEGCRAVLDRCIVMANQPGGLIRDGDVMIEDCVGLTEPHQCPTP